MSRHDEPVGEGGAPIREMTDQELSDRLEGAVRDLVGRLIRLRQDTYPRDSFNPFNPMKTPAWETASPVGGGRAPYTAQELRERAGHMYISTDITEMLRAGADAMDALAYTQRVNEHSQRVSEEMCNRALTAERALATVREQLRSLLERSV